MPDVSKPFGSIKLSIKELSGKEGKRMAYKIELQPFACQPRTDCFHSRFARLEFTASPSPVQLKCMSSLSFCAHGLRRLVADRSVSFAISSRSPSANRILYAKVPLRSGSTDTIRYSCPERLCVTGCPILNLRSAIHAHGFPKIRYAIIPMKQLRTNKE
jgi:hypothetical protein